MTNNRNLPSRPTTVQPSIFTAEGRAMLRSDREAEVRIRQAENDALVRDVQNKLNNELEKREIGRRLQRFQERIAAARIARDSAAAVAAGDPTMALELADYYAAYKANEIARQITDD